MKKLLFFILLVFMTVFASAQAVFNILPESDFVGSYPFIRAASVDEASNGWENIPNMEVPGNAITGFLALAHDDGTWIDPNGNPTADSLGCGPIVNGEDIVGKIAVIYRGACHFSLQAYNAQAAGAIGCMIVNAVAPFPDEHLGGGDSVDAIIIPTFMLDNDIVVPWRTEIEAGTMEAFFGNKNGLFDDDLGITTQGVSRAEHSSYPTVLSQNGNNVVQVGADIINYGLNTQTDVKLSAIILFEGNEVYNEISDAEVSMDNNDTIFFGLPSFTTNEFVSGNYEVTYEAVFGATDEFPGDNGISNSFMISDSLFSYSVINPETGLPNPKSFTRPSDAGANESVHNCIAFQDPAASSVFVEGLTFSSSYGLDDMTGVLVDVYLYEWTSEFVDVDDPNMDLSTESLDELAFGSFEYLDSIALERENIYVPFEDGSVTLEDDVRYLFCVNHFDEELFIGFDGVSTDYTTNFDFYRQPLFPIESNDVWNVAGFGADRALAMTVVMKDPLYDAINEEVKRVEITPFPNPTANEINIPVGNNYGQTMIDVYDIAGKKVKSVNVTTSSYEIIKFNVSDLDNGAYIFKMNFEDGSFSNFNVVVNN